MCTGVRVMPLLVSVLSAALLVSGQGSLSNTPSPTVKPSSRSSSAPSSSGSWGQGSSRAPSTSGPAAQPTPSPRTNTAAPTTVLNANSSSASARCADSLDAVVAAKSFKSCKQLKQADAFCQKCLLKKSCSRRAAKYCPVTCGTGCAAPAQNQQVIRYRGGPGPQVELPGVGAPGCHNTSGRWPFDTKELEAGMYAGHRNCLEGSCLHALVPGRGLTGGRCVACVPNSSKRLDRDSALGYYPDATWCPAVTGGAPARRALQLLLPMAKECTIPRGYHCKLLIMHCLERIPIPTLICCCKSATADSRSCGRACASMPALKLASRIARGAGLHAPRGRQSSSAVSRQAFVLRTPYHQGCRHRTVDHTVESSTRTHKAPIRYVLSTGMNKR